MQEAESFDPEVSDFVAGWFEFIIWCYTETGFSWTEKITLQDVEGHVSDPVDFSIACEPPQSPPIARSLSVEFGTEEQDAGGSSHENHCE